MTFPMRLQVLLQSTTTPPSPEMARSQPLVPQLPLALRFREMAEACS